jgi:hypothetical protein
VAWPAVLDVALAWESARWAGVTTAARPTIGMNALTSRRTRSRSRSGVRAAERATAPATRSLTFTINATDTGRISTTHQLTSSASARSRLNANVPSR